ncbi:MAG: leucine-rich repeat protein [Firmicutes bacterium]|nr:leucine-rich repeat protein [Bacillota bacterium]
MKRKWNLGGIFAMALILVLTLVLSVGSVSAAEPTIVDPGNCGKDGSNVTWTLDSAGLLTISGTGEMADYESKTDSASGEEITTAPWGNQAKTVVIGDGVTGIGAAAFYGCSGLTSVTMGSNVTSIGESAFCGCTGLTGIVLPGSVTSIGEYAFSNCESLTAIEIPEGVTTLGNSAFFGCDNLKEVRYNARAAANLTGLSGAFRSAGASVGGVKVIFGESVEKIPSNLFCNCESLTSVTIGSNVTSIGDNAFLDCKGLVEINYNARAAECTEDSFGSGDGLKVTFGDSVERIPDYIFQDCPGLTSVTIGSSATTIGHYAFNRCTGLTSIKIPESMTNIGYMAFSGCTSLADVYYGGSERQWNAITIDDGNDRLLQANRHCEGKETLVPPTVKPSYVGASGKPYIYWSVVDGANRYYVYRSTTKDGTYSFLGSTANLNYTDSKANVGTTYYYKVKALAADGTDSSLSAAVAITCRCARPVVTPDYLTSTGKPYIKWAAVAGASQYEVYRSGSKDGTYTLLGTTTATNYTDSKANAGYTYYYKVKALAADGTDSSLSAAVAATCHCARPVVKPDYLISTGKPYIKWTAVAGASQYEVYRSGSKDGTYTLLGTTTAANYTDSKANAGYTYYYKVKAISKVRSTANSSLSATVAATCHCARPVVKPDYLISTGKPYIKWTAVAGASQYEVYRSGSKDGTYTLLGTTTATNYTDNKANAGYTYYYKVKAVSKVSSGANSYYVLHLPQHRGERNI